MVLAAGDHAGGAALPGPGTHVAAQVVPLHVKELEDLFGVLALVLGEPLGLLRHGVIITATMIVRENL